MADQARARKVADRIKSLVAEYVEFRLKDERVGFLTITDVRVTGDLQNASVFYTVFGLGMAGLPALAGRVRDLSGDAFAPLGFAALLLGASVLSVLGFGLLRDRLLRPGRVAEE